MESITQRTVIPTVGLTIPTCPFQRTSSATTSETLTITALKPMAARRIRDVHAMVHVRLQRILCGVTYFSIRMGRSARRSRRLRCKGCGRCSPLRRCRLIQNEQGRILAAASSLGRSLEGKSAGARRTHSTVSTRRLRLQPHCQFRSNRCRDGSSRSHEWLHRGVCRTLVRWSSAGRCLCTVRARSRISHNDFPLGGYSTFETVQRIPKPF